MDVLLKWVAVQLQPLDVWLAPGTPEMYLPVFTLAAIGAVVANLGLIMGMGFSPDAGSRIVSQVHAAVASTLVAFAFIPALGGRFITDADPADIGLWPNNVPEWQWAWLIPAITCGYILGDFVIVLMYKELRDIPTVVHHCKFKTRNCALACPRTVLDQHWCCFFPDLPLKGHTFCILSVFCSRCCHCYGCLGAFRLRYNSASCDRQ